MANTPQEGGPHRMPWASPSSATDDTEDPPLDIALFFEKHGRIPDADRFGRWTFRVDGCSIRCSGTLPEAASNAVLFAHTYDLDAASLALVDYSPMTRVHLAKDFEH